jgi:ligand-binding sensor domain-containing protein
MGTQEGLARFTGVKFRVFDKKNVPHMPSNWVRTLCEDRDGKLWFGTYGDGLFCRDWRTGVITSYTQEHGLSNLAVWFVYEDRNGVLWIGCGSPLKGAAYTALISVMRILN